MRFEFRTRHYPYVIESYNDYIHFQKKIQSELRRAGHKSVDLRVLEIGTGTGITTEIIAKSYSRISLESLDISEEMIDEASSRLAGLNNIRFIVGDAVDYLTKCEDEKYDFVISGFTVHNFEQQYRQEFYNSVYRVLKKRAKFINIDKFAPNDSIRRIQAFKRRICRYIDICLRDDALDELKFIVEHYIEDLKPNRIMTFKNELEILREIGFGSCKFISKKPRQMLGILIATV